jgi:hypothetical protein
VPILEVRTYLLAFLKAREKSFKNFIQRCKNQKQRKTVWLKWWLNCLMRRWSKDVRSAAEWLKKQGEHAHSYHHVRVLKVYFIRTYWPKFGLFWMWISNQIQEKIHTLFKSENILQWGRSRRKGLKAKIRGAYKSKQGSISKRLKQVTYLSLKEKMKIQIHLLFATKRQFWRFNKWNQLKRNLDPIHLSFSTPFSMKIKNMRLTESMILAPFSFSQTT